MEAVQQETGLLNSAGRDCWHGLLQLCKVCEAAVMALTTRGADNV
jgi:hypothetical protein